MEKLDKSEINVETARAQADLAKQANNMLKYELDRANVQLKLEMHRRATGSTLKLREAEAKLVDEN